MSDERPPTRATLVWDGNLRFTAHSGAASLVLDSAGVAGPSPVQALVFAVAGCMGMDILYTLGKGRHPFTSLRVDLVGSRAQSAPHRLLKVEMQFAIGGDVPIEAAERAVALSREKYCSVWHSMRQDIQLDLVCVKDT